MVVGRLIIGSSYERALRVCAYNEKEHHVQSEEDVEEGIIKGDYIAVDYDYA